VSTGDGGAWLEGDAARRVACDAIIVPVVTADLDPGAMETLVGLCVQYAHLRRQAAAPGGPDGPDTPAGADGTDGQAAGTGRTAQVLAMLEHQILATVLQIVSGPGGVASFLMGKWQTTACLHRGCWSPRQKIAGLSARLMPSSFMAWWMPWRRPAGSGGCGWCR
jgi:hypothetical protein